MPEYVFYIFNIYHADCVIHSLILSREGLVLTPVNPSLPTGMDFLIHYSGFRRMSVLHQNLGGIRKSNHSALEISQYIPRFGGAWIQFSGGTLLRDNCQLIGMPLIVLDRQAQKNRD